MIGSRKNSYENFHLNFSLKKVNDRKDLSTDTVSSLLLKIYKKVTNPRSKTSQDLSIRLYFLLDT